MRGHDALIAMRIRGLVPIDVHIDTDASGAWIDWPEWCPEHAHLHIDAAERLALLDLRCVVGLMVMVHGDNLARVAEVEAACVEAGATRVVTFTVQGRQPEDTILTDTGAV